MTGQVIEFPYERCRACWNPSEQSALILILPVVRIEREHECPKIALLRRRAKMLREHFKPKFSGGER